MPSAAAISMVGKAYGYGRRTYRRLYQTTLAGPEHPFQVAQRILDETDEQAIRDLDQATFCEANWLRNQAILATKTSAKEVKPLIRAAIEADDRKTVLQYRRELSKARAAFRDELKKKGGITYGLNNPVARERSATRDAFILCLGFAEMQRREMERVFARWDNWLAGRAVTAENVTAYLDTQGFSDEKRKDLENILLGYVGAVQQAEQEMAAP